MAGFANPADAAIFTKLSADATLVSLLGGTAIYHAQIPEGAAAGTAVVFNAQSPSVPDRTFGGVYQENAVYQVKAVVQGRSAALAGTIAARIDTLLDGPTLTYTGFTHMGCQRIQEIDYAETAPGGIRFNHRGGLYRLRAHA